MIPTYISSIILKPGALYAFSESLSPLQGLSLDPMLGGLYYSVTRDLIVADGEELTDDDGKLTETLFMLASIVEVDDRASDQYPWLVDHIACGGYEDLNAGNMKALYEIAQSLVAKDDTDLITHVSFLGGWETESTFLREEGYSEVTAVDFVGRCKVVEIED